MKLILLLILAAVIVSLGSGLIFLVRDGQGSSRMLTALKIRVALSALLIGLLVLSWLMGWLTPQA
ncbi:MAG: twin transmembrane helix small protein [Gammaproteobacteria bacterium]|nr:twin transmembrane helix small protein [Gammaproteobacteria bacterium]MDH4314376.1 twin transmembrane helix small protein [Gammaproteobacteria bacterium]MDH5215863.1 twin transmembrane helix small protein [Gammaproteobacteria bacterium]